MLRMSYWNNRELSSIKVLKSKYFVQTFLFFQVYIYNELVYDLELCRWLTSTLFVYDGELSKNPLKGRLRELLLYSLLDLPAHRRSIDHLPLLHLQLNLNETSTILHFILSMRETRAVWDSILINLRKLVKRSPSLNATNSLLYGAHLCSQFRIIHMSIAKRNHIESVTIFCHITVVARTCL